MGSNAHSSPTSTGLQDVRGSNVTSVGGQNYKSNVNYLFTDHGAVGDSIHAVEELAQNVIEGVLDESEANRNFLGQGINRVLDQSDKNQNFIAKAGEAVGRFVKNEAEKNRAFIAQGTTEVLSQARANNAALTSGFNSAIGSISKNVDKAFSLVAGSQEKAIDSIVNTSLSTLDGLARFAGEFLNSSDKRNAENVEVLRTAIKSDSAQAFDKIILLAGASVVGVVAINIFRK